MFLQTVLMALREIRRNTLRSVLTMLGVVIGVGAVIALVSVGRGATQKVTEDISKLGKNLLMVSAGARVRGGASSAAQALSMVDMLAIKREISGVHAVAPGSSSNQQVIFGNKNAATSITGTDNNFFEVRGYSIDKGRQFTQGEAQSGVPVCVLGATVKTELFGNQDPLGTQVRVGKVSCQIIGTLVSKGTAGLGQDQDDLILMPLATFQRRITGNNDISLILVSAEEGRDTSIVAESIRALLRQRRHRPLGSDDDFNVRDMAEIADTVTSTTTALTALLGAIAAVSLLVGGIGIMNIMFVSVAERTREIGVRKAIGAKRRTILLQFLIEAATICLLGGLVGLVLTYGATIVISHLLIEMNMSLPIMALAIFVSLLTGVVSGFLPAWRAARMDPVEALRNE
jgi:putative ABC transport system permease protein